MAEFESSEDSEKTLIFSRPKPKTHSKSTVRKKGVAHKIIARKETTTSNVGPSHKGKGKEHLSTDEQVQDESKVLPVKENDPKVLLHTIHKFTSRILTPKLTIFPFLGTVEVGRERGGRSNMYPTFDSF